MILGKPLKKDSVKEPKKVKRFNFVQRYIRGIPEAAFIAYCVINAFSVATTLISAIAGYMMGDISGWRVATYTVYVFLGANLLFIFFERMFWYLCNLRNESERE